MVDGSVLEVQMCVRKLEGTARAVDPVCQHLKDSWPSCPILQYRGDASSSTLIGPGIQGRLLDAVATALIDGSDSIIDQGNRGLDRQPKVKQETESSTTITKVTNGRGRDEVKRREGEEASVGVEAVRSE